MNILMGASLLAQAKSIYYGKVSIVTNGRIGANRKGYNSNGSIGEYASH